MFKLIKYEFLKNRISVFVMTGLLIMSELIFLNAYRKDDGTDHRAILAISVVFLCAFVCFIMVFIIGVTTYSRELSSKTSYLVFMTPNSAMKIICSKLLFTLFTGIVFAAASGGLLIYDRYLLADELTMLETILNVLKTFGVNVTEIVYNIISSIISFLITFFMVIMLAYLSVTLTATVLQNRKIKGLISTALFIFSLWGVTKIGSFLPTLYEVPENMIQASLMNLPLIIFFAVIIAGSIVATAQLLERKVSL